jgi:hypothetical protein
MRFGYRFGAIVLALSLAGAAQASTTITLPGGGTLQSGALDLHSVPATNNFYSFVDARAHPALPGAHYVGNGVFSSWSSTPTTLSLAYHFDIQLTNAVPGAIGNTSFQGGVGTVSFYLTDLSNYRPTILPLVDTYAYDDATYASQTAAVEAGTLLASFDANYGNVNAFASSSQFGSSFSIGAGNLTATGGIGAGLFAQGATLSIADSQSSPHYVDNPVPVDTAELRTTLSPITVTVGGAPEPASWAMMLVGFGLTGAALRRRSNAAVRVKFA